MQRRNLLRPLVAVFGLVGFALLMALRQEVPSVAGRAAMATLAALVGASAFLYLQRTKPRQAP